MHFRVKSCVLTARKHVLHKAILHFKPIPSRFRIPTCGKDREYPTRSFLFNFVRRVNTKGDIEKAINSQAKPVTARQRGL